MRTKLVSAAAAVLAALLLLGPAVTASSVGSFQNGDFACSVDGSACRGPFTTLNAVDSTSIATWTVTQNSVDWIKTYWEQPSTGSYSIDMNGTRNAEHLSANGQIAQTFATSAGATYVVAFQLSGNFNSACQLPTPGRQTLWVDAPAVPGGTATADLGSAYTFTEPSSWSYTNMGWTVEKYSFTAAQGTTSSTLTFTADPNNTTNCGPAVGDVSVTEAPTSTVNCSGSCQAGALSPTTGVNGGVNTNSDGSTTYQLTAAFGAGTLNCDGFVSHGGPADPLAVTATSTVGGAVTLTFPPSFFSKSDLDPDDTPVCFGAGQRFPTWLRVPGSSSFPYQGLLFTCGNPVYQFVTRHRHFPLTACISSYSWTGGAETVAIQTSSFGSGGGDPMYW